MGNSKSYLSLISIIWHYPYSKIVDCNKFNQQYTHESKKRFNCSSVCQWLHLGRVEGVMPPLISGGDQFQPRNSLFIRLCSTCFFILPHVNCEVLLNSKVKILDDYCISRKYPVFAVLPN